jgi:hypothetical protein
MCSHKWLLVAVYHRGMYVVAYRWCERCRQKDFFPEFFESLEPHEFLYEREERKTTYEDILRVTRERLRHRI